MKSSDLDGMQHEKLLEALSNMFGTRIIGAECETEQLHGGTLGDVKLVMGTAEAVDGGKLQYKLVLKIQKKWERYGDPDSWRREYDLYASPLGSLFAGPLRWPRCYLAEMDGDEWRIWMEYIDGASGVNLTVGMLEQAAMELGRFQGRLYKENPTWLECYRNMGTIDFMKADYNQWEPTTVEYRYIRSGDCTLPKHLCRMLLDMDDEIEAIFEKIKQLPIVFCHRDFWSKNIFYLGG